MSSPRYDVAIVGYGPVGQLLAVMLGRRGWSVVVFDKQRSLFPLPRACHLDHEAMRILQSAGLAEEVRGVVVPAREYLLLRDDLTVLADLPRRWAAPTGWESSYHFFQPDLESIFDRAAKRAPGVEVRQGVAVRRIVDTGELVSIDTDDGVVSARFVIGADGANSVVRASAGIEVDDLGFEATWVVADVELRDGVDPLDIPDTAQVLDPAQPRHMAWLGGRHYRWEFMVVDGLDPAVAARPDEVWRKLGRWVDPASATLLRAAPYTFRSLIASTFAVGRVAIAGDAAHVMPPFLGQGMVSGMRDAVTLTWMLDLVLRGIAPLRLLDGYTASRRPHVAAYIAESVQVGQLVCETDVVKAAARDRRLEAQSAAAPPFQPRVGGFHLGGRLDGGLAVQPRVGADGRLLHDVVGSGFALIAGDAAVVRDLPPRFCAVLDELGATAVVIEPDGPDVVGVADDPAVTSFVERGSAFVDWLAASAATWVLVRPDGYVYASGSGVDAAGAAIARLRLDITADTVVGVTASAGAN